MDREYRRIVTERRRESQAVVPTSTKRLDSYLSGQSTNTNVNSKIFSPKPSDITEKKEVHVLNNPKSGHEEVNGQEYRGSKFLSPQNWQSKNGLTECNLLVFDDPPTEYKDWKLSSPRVASDRHSKKKHHMSTSCQTDIYDCVSMKGWPKTYSSALRNADKRLSVLQEKVRESLVADMKYLSPDGLKLFNENDKLIQPLQNRAIASSEIRTSPKYKSPERQLNFLNPTDSRALLCEMSSQRFKVLSSPTFNVGSGSEPSINCCPEVGISPSEAKAKISSDKIKTSLHELQGIKQVSSGSTKIDGRTQTNDQAHTPRSKTEQQNPTSPLPTLLDSPLDFPAGFGHLLEERSRLQRKLLKLKLFYKTYKQRLAGLDSSLLALQQPIQTNSHLEKMTNSPFDKTCQKHALNLDIKQSSLQSGSSSPSVALLNQVQSDDLEMANLRAESSKHKFMNNSNFRRSLSRSCIGKSHTSSERGRSLSSVRPPNLHRCNSQSPRLLTSSQNNKVPHNLAVSLASIDVQLHHVLDRLTILDTAKDTDVHSPDSHNFHPCGDSNFSSCQPNLHHQSTSSILRDRSGVVSGKDSSPFLSSTHHMYDCSGHLCSGSSYHQCSCFRYSPSFHESRRHLN